MVCVIGGLSGYGEWQPSYLSKKKCRTTCYS